MNGPRGRSRVLVEIEEDARGSVARLVYDRSHKLNSLDRDGMAAFAERVRDLHERPGLRCLVITGAGDNAFVGGADLDTLAALDGETGRAFIAELHALLRAIRGLPVPTVARINGWCLGAGMELAAACDLRVASTAAQFGMPEVKVGIPSVIEAALLPRLIGQGRAARLVLTGETVDAATAERWGFVEELATPSELDGAVARLVEAILEAGPGAVRHQKRLLGSWERDDLDTSIKRSIGIFGEACETGEHARMIGAFRERRQRR